ncbi:MAG: OmpA family protein [Crocinitomicaceae bacterium]|nr:OmpA family protein [Crocinitomicaceae bacterium]
MKTQFFLFSIALVLVFTGCVPQRKYAELDSRKKSLESENVLLRKENEQFEAQAKEMSTSIETKDLSINRLTADTTRYGKDYRQLRSQYDKILELNTALDAKNESMMKNVSSENQKLLTELNKAQDDLKRKEDALKQLEKTVNEKQSAVDAANANLKDREAKLLDMQQLLKAQEEASAALKEKVSAALTNFKDKGLTVREENGKVYVSMEAKLLFASGSTAVDPNGKKAIVDLAKAIENEVDMEVIVEGHTDTDKISSSSIPRDNWELSVLRATEVVKIMTSNSKIKPAMLSASGRSEYQPVSSTDKAKNRRIEIILQPDLGELYKIIETK